MQFIQILTVRFHDDPCQLDYTDACSTAGPNFRIVLPDLSLIQIIKGKLYIFQTNLSGKFKAQSIIDLCMYTHVSSIC